MAHMTTKADFSPDEWDCLHQLPWIAGVIIVLADPSLRQASEFKAMTKAISEPGRYGAADGLIESLVTEMKDSPEHDDFEFDRNDDDDDDLIHQIARAARMIDIRCDRGEARGLKQWVLDVAVSTAEAHKEGGFLGIGATSVSDPEVAALARIRSMLRL